MFKTQKTDDWHAIQKKKKRVGKSVSSENADSYVDMHLHINEDYLVIFFFLDFTRKERGG